MQSTKPTKQPALAIIKLLIAVPVQLLLSLSVTVILKGPWDNRVQWELGTSTAPAGYRMVLCPYVIFFREVTKALLCLNANCKGQLLLNFAVVFQSVWFVLFLTETQHMTSVRTSLLLVLCLQVRQAPQSLICYRALALRAFFLPESFILFSPSPCVGGRVL